MKYMWQFGIILAVTVAGELLNYIIPLNIPASVYGLVIMLVLLRFGIIKLWHVKETASFLIKIMPLMFIPAAVGVIDYFDLFVNNIIAFILIIVGVTVAVMAVTGIVTQAVMRKDGGKKL